MKPDANVHCLDPREVQIPELSEDGVPPTTKAGEFGVVLLASGFPVPTGAVKLVWELSLDRTPPPTRIFCKPKAWLTQRSKIKKGNWLTHIQ